MSEEGSKSRNGEQLPGANRGFWARVLEDLRLPFLLSIFLAIPAFIFGIVAFWETHQEAFDATSAYLNPALPTKSGYGLHLTLANNGNPPVVIDRASLDLPGAPHNMPIYYYLADPRVIDRYSTDPTGVDAEKQTLPIVVNPHSAQTVVLLTHPETLNNGRTNLPIAREEQQAFCNFLGTGHSRPTLILHLIWSGFVYGGPFQPAPSTESVQVGIAGAKSREPSWSARASGPADAPSAVLLRHRLADPSVGGLAKMVIYRHSEPRPIYALQRPLVGHSPTAFPLPRLDSGTYLIAFSVDGQVVVSSRLTIPTPKPDYSLTRNGQTGFCSRNAEIFRQRIDAFKAAEPVN